MLACVLIVSFLSILAIETIDMPGQNSVRAICTGLGIDYENSAYSVSAQIVIPEAGGEYAQKQVIVNNSAPSVEKALLNMEFQVGKKIRLGHCGFIIMNKEFCSQDITKELDYFLRGNNLGNNTLLFFTPDKAQKVLEKTSNVNSNEVDNLQINSKYNRQHLLSNCTNLISFFNDYLSPHKTSYMPSITLSSNETSEQSGQGQEQGSQDSSPSSQPSKDSIKNDGALAVFVEGKCTKVLTPSECENFQWFDKNISNSHVRLSNVNTHLIKDGDISFALAHKCIKFDYQIVKDIPIISLTLDLGLKPEAINSSSHVPAYTGIVDDVISANVAAVVDTSIQHSLSLMSQYEMDLFNFYHGFNLNCHNEWKKYLNTLSPTQHYLNNIKIVSNITCTDEF